MYRLLGALDGLMIDLGRSKGPPKFEMDVRGKISHGRNSVVNEVPFRVKPDLHFINEHGAFVILDWKVNGYCSPSGRSPTPGFVKARRQGKLHWTHDDCTLGTHKGLIVNTKKSLELYDSEWARQCSIGAWVCGAPVISNFVSIIHQLACLKSTGSGPRITVAEHAGFVSPDYQDSLHAEAYKMWSAIHDRIHVAGCNQASCNCPRHIFRSIPLEDSIALCKILDKGTGGRSSISPALEEM
jgi:hypothetical protein